MRWLLHFYLILRLCLAERPKSEHLYYYNRIHLPPLGSYSSTAHTSTTSAPSFWKRRWSEAQRDQVERHYS